MGSLSLLQITDFLGSVALFRGLGRDALQRFAEVTREKRYPKGSVIVFADDPGDSLYTLAHMIGASRETVSRTLRDLQDAYLLSDAQRVIQITDRPALARRSTIKM